MFPSHDQKDGNNAQLRKQLAESNKKVTGLQQAVIQIKKNAGGLIRQANNKQLLMKKQLQEKQAELDAKQAELKKLQANKIWAT